MSVNALLMQATASTTTPAEVPSIWTEVQPWEIALLGAGAVLTLAILGFFIWLAVRAGREERGARAG